MHYATAASFGFWRGARARALQNRRIRHCFNGFVHRRSPRPEPLQTYEREVVPALAVRRDFRLPGLVVVNYGGVLEGGSDAEGKGDWDYTRTEGTGGDVAVGTVGVEVAVVHPL